MQLESKTMLIELPEKFWNLAEIFAAAQHTHDCTSGPGTVSKIIESAIQAGLMAQFGFLTIVSPDTAAQVEAAIQSKELSQWYITTSLKKGESGEHKP